MPPRATGTSASPGTTAPTWTGTATAGTATDKPGTPESQVTGIGKPFGVRPLSGTEGIPAALMQALANPGPGIYPPDIFLGWPFQQFRCAFNPDVQTYSCTRG